MTKVTSKREEFMREVETQATAVLADKLDLGNDQARQLGAEIAEEVCRALAGSQVYVPKVPDFSKRDLEIYERFNGENRDELCTEYGITARRLYQIVGRVRRRRVAVSRASATT